MKRNVCFYFLLIVKLNSTSFCWLISNWYFLMHVYTCKSEISKVNFLLFIFPFIFEPKFVTVTSKRKIQILLIKSSLVYLDWSFSFFLFFFFLPHANICLKKYSYLLQILPLGNSFVNFKMKLYMLMADRRCLNINWFSITSVLIVLWTIFCYTCTKNNLRMKKTGY